MCLTGIVLQLHLAAASHAGPHLRHVTLSTARSRPIAMGGAFITMNDDLAALCYNPAGFDLQGSRFATAAEGRKAWLFLNPAGSILALTQNDRYSDRSVPISLIFSGIGFRFGRFQIGLLPGEESYSAWDRLDRGQFYSLAGYAENRNLVTGFSITLAPKVSIGAAGELYYRGDGLKARYLGHRYGILVRPRSNMTVGLCYFDIPNSMPDERMTLDRFSDETLNLGISWRPLVWMTIAGDVRNVSDEGRGDAVEPHFGAEIEPVPHLFLRTGYYHVFGTGETALSAGIGTDDFRSMLFMESFLSRIRIKLESTFVYRKRDEGTDRWLLTSLLIIL